MRKSGSVLFVVATAAFLALEWFAVDRKFGVIGAALAAAAATIAVVLLWRWIGDYRRPAVFVYLVAGAVASLYLACTLWMTDFQKDPCGSEPKPPVPGQTGVGAGKEPVITSLDPGCVSIGSGRSTVSVVGNNFGSPESKATVRLDGAERETRFVSSGQLAFSLRATDFRAPGKVPVTVLTTDGESAPVNLEIISAGDVNGQWPLYGTPCRIPISKELQLVLLVIATGALGACIVAVKSFVDYFGDQKLTEHWFAMYLAKPFFGIGLALIFYLVIRGGFLSGTTADASAVNPFGVVAIGALAGMFHDKALTKLGEVFDSLFKSVDTRSGKLATLRVESPSPLPNATANKAYSFRLTASGGTTYTWSKVTDPPAGLDLDGEGKGVLSGTPSVAGPPADFTVQVTDASGATDTKELRITVLP